MTCRLLASDLHLESHQREERLLDGMPQSIYDFARLGAAMARVCAEEKVDAIDLLGDIFHHRETVGALALVTFVRVMAGMTPPKRVLRGNHDLLESLSAVSAIEGVRGFDAITSPYDDTWILDDGLAMLRYVPYALDEDGMAEALAAPPYSYGRPPAVPVLRRYAFTHGMFRTALRGPWDYFGETAGIPMEVTTGYDLVVSGHVHAHQVLARPGAKGWLASDEGDRLVFKTGAEAVHYLGSPYALNAKQALVRNGFWTMHIEPSGTRMQRHVVPSAQYVEVSTVYEAQAALERFEPQDIHLRAFIFREEDRAKLVEIGQHCRSFSCQLVRREDQEQVEAGMLRVHEAQNEEELFRAYVDWARPDLPEHERASLARYGLRIAQGVA